MMTKWLILALAMTLGGCVTSGRLSLCGGMIQNRSGRELANIRVVHYPTHRVVMTNLLLPDRSFRLGFDERTLEASMATLTWEDPELGLLQSTVSLPTTALPKDESRWLIYQISSAGSVEVGLGPCP